MNIIKTHYKYVLGLFLIAAFIFYPEVQGKKLNSHDVVSWYSAAKEFNLYREKGEEIQWTNRIFSGMPLFTMAGVFQGNYIGHIFSQIVEPFPDNVINLFILFFCTYISLLFLRVNNTLAFILSIANGLNIFILGSLWAGHSTKILSMSFLLPVIAGIIAYFKYNNIKGVIAVGIGTCLSLSYGHYQMVYYGFIIIVFIGIYLLFDFFKNKGESVEFIKKIALTIAVAVLGATTSIAPVLTASDFKMETMRGGKTELTKTNATSTSKSGGLDFNYAMSWSYSWEELLSFIVPDALGGSSNYKLKSKKSALAQAMNSPEEEVTLPMYFGIQPFSGAPNYLGVSIFVLFIFSCFYYRNSFKYILIALCTLSLFMGLGRSFPAFNQVLFDYLPMYNSFRTPSMAFSILNCMSILLIGLAIHQLISDEKSEINYTSLIKKTGLTVLGLIIIGYIMVNSLGYTSIQDAQQFQDNKQALDLMIEDRMSFFKSDIIRTLILAAITLGLLFYYLKNQLSSKVFYIVLGVLIFFDLWSVHKRYFYTDVFEKIENYESLIPNESWNAYLEQDKSHFRIFNTTSQSVFNDNTDGYRYSNVGGYSPAKLYRYQDLIDMHLSKGNMPVLNMLNTKYFIAENNGQKIPQQNPDACGNVWYVKEVKFAKNADEEMDSIGTFNPKNTVWIDQRYKNDSKYSVNTDPNASITLSKYHPDNMEYTSNSASGGFAVFSEIWYKGNVDWKIYIDGKESKMIRVNYLLRGAYIPAGNHKVEMKFYPVKGNQYKMIATIATILLLVIFGGIFYFLYKRK